MIVHNFFQIMEVRDLREKELTSNEIETIERLCECRLARCIKLIKVIFKFLNRLNNS